VLTGAGDNTVRLWGIESQEELHRYDGHTGPVLSVSFSPDGLRALSGSADTTMRLWDLEGKSELHCFEGHTDDCRNVRFFHDGRRAISCSHDHTIRLWDLETRQEIRRFPGHTDNVYAVDVTRDNRRAVSTGKDGTIRVWDVGTGAELFQLQSPSPAGFSSVAISPDGKRALSGGHDGAVRLWDLDRRTELNPGRVLPMRVNASRIAFSQDGRRIVTCINNHGLATVWDVASGRPLRTIKKVGQYVCAALSPDGRYAVCGGQWGLSVWSVETGEELRQFEGSAVAWDVAISRDGRTVMGGDHVGSDGSVRMWQFDSGRLMTPIGGHWGAVYAVALSTDSRRAVSGGWDKMFRLWDLESGDLLHQWQLSNHVWSVALSADGRYAAASDDNGNIALRDLSGNVPKILPLPKKHVGRLRAIAFSADNQTLLSAGYDGRILLWDVGSGTVRVQWQFPGAIVAARFAPDGRHLATVNANATVYVLRLNNK
jgi:WD40 repeat protein